MFEAVPLDYSIIEKQNYHYMLDGYDRDWIFVSSSRYILYKNVSEGRYTFRVRNDETGEQHALRLTIHPPFYRSWWFLSLVGAGIVVLAGIFYSQRIAHLKREKEEELRHLQERQQIEQEKAILANEMELAKQIQTAILPRGVTHDDLDIEATMLPADEVGGDYYDMLYAKDGTFWLAIGDVSGHGVTPGLIMMIAQTIHATITTMHPNVSPIEVINMVNERLYHNVQKRLQKDHFMTFTTLKYHGQGRFEYAGAHLDLIVHRQASGACELFDTPGVFLNLLPDISHATQSSEFTLNIGDTLVLYTDGLIEARNPDGELLDMSRFIDIISAHAAKDPAAMRDAILDDVLAWSHQKRADDMSIMVVRRGK
jgi:serine phosphatase RsbU (regulator of sigma subunit)